jgi:hypothetical protein
MTDCIMDLSDSGARVTDTRRVVSITMSLLIAGKRRLPFFKAVSPCVVDVRRVL